MIPTTANRISGYCYDASGNTTSDTVYSYNWNAESQLKSAGGVNYLYDGDGRRMEKVGSKLYWYGSGDQILAETDASGNATAEYVFFGGKRIAMLPSGGNPLYYVSDLLGTSRVMTSNTGVVCYDADFYPYGGERAYTNTCPQNYKFEGKERDAETGNDDFDARYYSNRFGRWLSADWSAVPAPVPYANFTNPQTLNLYAMVSDDPESFADLDGHCPTCVEEIPVIVEEIAEHPQAAAVIVEAVDAATKKSATGAASLGAALLLALQMAGDNPPPKKPDSPAPTPATATPPQLGPTPQPTAPITPPVFDSSRRHTRDKHTKPHPSRTGDKLRKRPDWVPKKKSGGGSSSPKKAQPTPAPEPSPPLPPVPPPPRKEPD